MSTFTRRNDHHKGLNSLDAMICLAMCYRHFEEYFHVFISIQTLHGVVFKSIKNLFQQNFEFFAIRDQLYQVWCFFFLFCLLNNTS